MYTAFSINVWQASNRIFLHKNIFLITNKQIKRHLTWLTIYVTTEPDFYVPHEAVKHTKFWKYLQNKKSKKTLLRLKTENVFYFLYI